MLQPDPPMAILAQVFALGSVQSMTPIQQGLIQETWRCDTDRGAFIVQKLHPAFQPTVTEDAAAVTDFVREHGIPAPTFLRTDQGSLHWQQWRVMTCLPGTTWTQIPSVDSLHSVGFWTGRLHHVLEAFQAPFQFQLPNFHNTAAIWQQLADLEPTAMIADRRDWLLAMAPQVFLPQSCATQVIHGDLKISNFLLDADGHVVGILDWDTCMRHSVYVDLGDGLRSWCASGSRVNPEALTAALRGYADSGALAQRDPQLIVRGWQLLCVELAMRFVIDAVEDRYFQWDAQRFPSRVAHNLARADKHIALVQHIQAQQDEWLGILTPLFHD
ncbi:MAG: aminoglycoside phosphotransferase family protein [Synechococcales cyanobacterium]